MAEQHYDLFFSGQILDGFFEDFVKADLKVLFKTDDAYIDQLFSGQVRPIKKKVDKKTAVKFQRAFKQAGARLIVKQHAADAAAGSAPATKPSQPKSAQPRQQAAPAAVNAELVTTAVQGENDDSLIEHHQPDIKPPEQIPQWSVSAPGAQLSEQTEQRVAEIDTSDLTIAQPGADLSDETQAPPVADITTDHLSVAPPGTELETLDDKAAPVQVDISHIKLS